MVPKTHVRQFIAAYKSRCMRSEPSSGLHGYYTHTYTPTHRTYTHIIKININNAHMVNTWVCTHMQTQQTLIYANTLPTGEHTEACAQRHTYIQSTHKEFIFCKCMDTGKEHTTHPPPSLRRCVCVCVGVQNSAILLYFELKWDNIDKFFHYLVSLIKHTKL